MRLSTLIGWWMLVTSGSPSRRTPSMPVAEALVVVHHVEVRRPARPARARALRLNVSGSGNAPPHIMAVSSTSAQSRYSCQRGVRNGSPSRYRSRLGISGQPRARVQLGIGLAGEHLDVVPERVQFPAQVADVDALAAGVRLAAVGEQRDPERAVRGYHGLMSRDGPVSVLASDTVEIIRGAP